MTVLQDSPPPSPAEASSESRAPASVGLGDLLTALRLLFEILVLGAGVFVVFLQPFSKAVFNVCLGLAVGIWCLALWLRSAWRRRGGRRAALLRILELTLFNLCLFAVLAEVGLRLVAWVSPSPLLARDDDRPSGIIRKSKQHRRPGDLYFGFPVNAQSHYDTEFTPRREGRPVVAMVGDSFSYGVVPHHYHMSAVCERELEATAVYNFGYPGIGPLEYRYLLRTEVLDLAPDVVAVNLFVGNDVQDSARGEVRHRALRSWLDRDNLLLDQLPRRLAVVRAEKAGRPREAPVGGLQGEGARRRLATVKEMTAVYPWLADPSRERPTMSAERFLRIESARAAAVCDPARADFSALFAILRDVRRLAGETPLVVHLIPDEFQVNDRLWRRVRRHLRRRDLERDLPQQTLGRWLDAEGIPHLDLLPVLRARCAPHSRGDEHCYHFRNTHFNARGNRIAGEAMARFLAPFVTGGELSP